MNLTKDSNVVCFDIGQDKGVEFEIERTNLGIMLKFSKDKVNYYVGECSSVNACSSQNTSLPRLCLYKDKQLGMSFNLELAENQNLGKQVLDEEHVESFCGSSTLDNLSLFSLDGSNLSDGSLMSLPGPGDISEYGPKFAEYKS